MSQFLKGHFGVCSKNIIEADSDDENEMNNVPPVPKSFEGEQSNPDGAVDQGGIGFQLLLGNPCRGSTGGGQFLVRLTLIRKYGGLGKIKFLRWAKLFPVPIGLTREQIFVLKPSPCLHNANEVDDWMGLDEWNRWFKSQVQDSNRSQDIVNLKSLKHLKSMEKIAL
ncbi:uncharacterized protein TNCV_3913311 [Trichonephila clavipes]|nr:uncharacterized protein TNCV_3913311 [Trichonephila clavipes]